MANQRGRRACLSLIGAASLFFHGEEAPRGLYEHSAGPHDAQERKKPPWGTFASHLEGALCSLFALSAVASYTRLRMTKTTDDDDKGRRRRSEREKPKLILLCFSPPHRYLLPLFHPPSSSTQLRVRGGPLIHRKVGQPDVAAPMKMNYDVGGPLLIPYWRCSHLSFRQLLHALSSLPCPACELDIVIIAPRLVANGGLHATCALRSIHFIIHTQHKTLFGNFQKTYPLNSLEYLLNLVFVC